MIPRRPVTTVLERHLLAYLLTHCLQSLNVCSRRSSEGCGSESAFRTPLERAAITQTSTATTDLSTDRQNATALKPFIHWSWGRRRGGGRLTARDTTARIIRSHPKSIDGDANANWIQQLLMTAPRQSASRFALHAFL